jgi:hypothetical protein
LAEDDEVRVDRILAAIGDIREKVVAKYAGQYWVLVP